MSEMDARFRRALDFLAENGQLETLVGIFKNAHSLATKRMVERVMPEALEAVLTKGTVDVMVDWGESYPINLSFVWTNEALGGLRAVQECPFRAMIRERAEHVSTLCSRAGSSRHTRLLEGENRKLEKKIPVDVAQLCCANRVISAHLLQERRNMENKARLSEGTVRPPRMRGRHVQVRQGICVRA